MSRKTDLFQGY